VDYTAVNPLLEIPPFILTNSLSGNRSSFNPLLEIQDLVLQLQDFARSSFNPLLEIRMKVAQPLRERYIYSFQSSS